MTSGFPGGGGPDFYNTGGGRSTPMMSINNNPQLPYRSVQHSGILPEQTPPMVYRGADLIGKRSFAELQHHHQQQQQQQRLLHQQQQFQQNLSLGNFFNFRNVKPRINYQQNHSSSLSPVDFSDISSLSPEMSSISNPRYGHPVLHQMNNNFQNLSNGGNKFYSGSTISVTNSLPNQWVGFNTGGHETISDSNSVRNYRVNETISDSNSVYNNQRVGLNTGQTFNLPENNKMLNQLQELEKALLGDEENDNDNGSGDGVSVVTNSEWSDIQNLNLMCANGNNNQKPISLSPTSSSSSCSSTSASPPITCPKQSITDAATAIYEGRTEVAADILTRLFRVSNSRGSFEQRLTAYMALALRSRLKPSEYPPIVSELYGKEHVMSTQMLYDNSPCFKLGFMAANRAILEATVLQEPVITLHVIDFDIGQGGQYVHLLYALEAEKVDKQVSLRITTFSDPFNVGDERLMVVGDRLKVLADKLGVCFNFSVNNSKICDLSRENLFVKDEETLVVNLAFKLYKLPDESVTTENLRDELLRRVKGLSPTVVTVVEQEMNANTASFVARVNENYGYYSVLFESLDATLSMESPERVKIEEGLGRIMNNSVACEGRDRIERCEVFGKWRARMSMAGFDSKPISPLVADSLRSKLNSGTRGNPGFTVNEKSGGICFGWKERTLILASAWR